MAHPPGAALPKGKAFRPRERLRSGSEFRRVFAKGLRFDGSLFLLVAAENHCGYSRLGLAASRRLGGAVARNRARRLLRESFRLNKLASVPGFDLVLVPKREMSACTLGEVEREYRKRLRRLVTRRGSTSASASSSASD